MFPSFAPAKILLPVNPPPKEKQQKNKETKKKKTTKNKNKQTQKQQQNKRTHPNDHTAERTEQKCFYDMNNCDRNTAM